MVLLLLHKLLLLHELLLQELLLLLLLVQELLLLLLVVQDLLLHECGCWGGVLCSLRRELHLDVFLGGVVGGGGWRDEKEARAEVLDHKLFARAYPGRHTHRVNPSLVRGMLVARCAVLH